MSAKLYRFAATIPVIAALVFTATAAAAAGQVNVYSYRQEFLIRPLLEAFTAKTGIKVNVIYASKA